MDLNVECVCGTSSKAVSLREKGVDLNVAGVRTSGAVDVSLREKGVDLNKPADIYRRRCGLSPFVRREWI